MNKKIKQALETLNKLATDYSKNTYNRAYE